MVQDMTRKHARDRPDAVAPAEEAAKTEAPELEPTSDDRHGAPSEAAAQMTRRVVESAASMAGAVVDVADDLVDSLRPTAEHLAASTGRAAVGGARRVRHPSRSRVLPLPNLYQLHPEARNAPLRELGLLSVPIDEIVGTGVEGIAQRGTDFRPLPPFRSKNWEARWQRILRAMQRMESLPPVDVLHTRDGYWVTDGHNRIAAAKAIGQLEVDADVKAVVLPGEPLPRPTGSLAPVLAESAHIEAAARGRLTRGTTLGRTVQERDLGPQPGDADEPGAAADDGDDAEAGR